MIYSSVDNFPLFGSLMNEIYVDELGSLFDDG